MLQNIEEIWVGVMAGATRPAKRGSELKGKT
jgi:hypothetical protein